MADSVEHVLLPPKDMDELRNLKKYKLFLSIKRDLALLKETFLKLLECDKARKSAEASIESTERRAQEQLQHSREAESQLAIAQMTIFELKKELNQKNEEVSKVKQATYEQGQKETKSHLKSQILVAYHSFCLQTWVEALNAAGVDPFSELRNSEKGVLSPSN
nr:hypothetical protein CFP56_66198 [Quercus suber]